MLLHFELLGGDEVFALLACYFAHTTSSKSYFVPIEQAQQIATHRGLNKDPTVWLDGTGPGNACIPP